MVVRWVVTKQLQTQLIWLNGGKHEIGVNDEMNRVMQTNIYRTHEIHSVLAWLNYANTD